MHLTRLNIERVRNLKTVALQGLQPFNVFYGANGSGKTSILEAIHLLATGRSFRTHIPKNYKTICDTVGFEIFYKFLGVRDS